MKLHTVKNVFRKTSQRLVCNVGHEIEGQEKFGLGLIEHYLQAGEPDRAQKVAVRECRASYPYGSGGHWTETGNDAWALIASALMGNKDETLKRLVRLHLAAYEETLSGYVNPDTGWDEMLAGNPHPHLRAARRYRALRQRAAKARS